MTIAILDFKRVRVWREKGELPGIDEHARPFVYIKSWQGLLATNTLAAGFAWAFRVLEALNQHKKHSHLLLNCPL